MIHHAGWLLLLALTGCAGMGLQDAQGGAKLAETDVVTLRLAEAAEKAARALDSIASVEQVRTPAPPLEDFSGAPPELMERITITWSGPIEPLAKQLADRAGYSFDTAGATPAVPLVININAFDKPLIKVLRDAGLQAGTTADVAVDAIARQIMIRYAPREAGAVDVVSPPSGS